MCGSSNKAKILTNLRKKKKIKKFLKIQIIIIIINRTDYRTNKKKI